MTSRFAGDDIITRYDITLHLTPADARKVRLNDITSTIACTMLTAGITGRWATTASEHTTDLRRDVTPELAAHLTGNPALGAERNIVTQKPATGRIVHYVSYGTPGGEYSRECRAALITEAPGTGVIPIGPELVSPETVGLAVMNPTGMFFNRTVPYDEGRDDQAGGTNLCGGLDYRGGTWHWPEHV